ncbi:MAG: helix-turn-helix domain-containing protein [Candidatus Paceibacterota bacterium]|jgi:sugar-specific transcriptional regulator TrmB
MTPPDLQTVGLDAKEATAYLALLELGEAAMGQLVKKSRLKRTTLYDTIESLKQRNLVSVSKKNKKIVYVAENPRKIIEQLDDKRASAEKMLPELLSITNVLQKKPRIRYFEGIDGIKEVYKDTLRFPDQKLQAWVSEEMIYKFDQEFLDHYYTPRRLEKKIWAEVIAPDLPDIRAYAGLDRESLRVTRLIDPAKFPFEVEISLYGPDHIGIMSFREKLGLILESESISRTLKSIFALQWEMLKDLRRSDETS